MKKILLLCITTVAVFFVTAGVSYVETSSLMKSYENAVGSAFMVLFVAFIVAGFYYSAQADKIIAERGSL